MTPTLQEIRALINANEAQHPEIAVLELQIGNAVGSFRDTEGEVLKRFWRDGYPVGFAQAKATGIFTGEFHVLMALTLPAFRNAMAHVARLNAAPELEARGRDLIVLWETVEAKLEHIGALSPSVAVPDAPSDVPAPAREVWARWPAPLRESWVHLWRAATPAMCRQAAKVEELFECYEWIHRSPDPDDPARGARGIGHKILNLEGELGITSELRRAAGLPDLPAGTG